MYYNEIEEIPCKKNNLEQLSVILHLYHILVCTMNPPPAAAPCHKRQGNEHKVFKQWSCYLYQMVAKNTVRTCRK